MVFDIAAGRMLTVEQPIRQPLKTSARKRMGLGFIAIEGINMTRSKAVY